MFRISIYILLLVLLTASCIQQSKAPDAKLGIVKSDPETYFLVNSEGDTIPTGVPIPVEGKRIDPDSVSEPKTIPLKGKPKVTPAHTNVYPMAKPKIVPVPKELTVITLGKNGVPIPKIVPAQGKVVPARYPKPVPALPLRRKDAAHQDIQYLDVEQGMLSSSVYSMLEDSRGNLWFGTEGALSRYNGSSFLHFGSEEGLNGENIATILEDQQGNIWIGYLPGGISRYDGKTFTHFTAEEGLIDNKVRSMFEDSRGNLWIGTDRGVSCYYPDAYKDLGGFAHYTSEEGLTEGWIETIMEDSQGNIWFGGGGFRGGVSRYTPNSDSRNGTGGSFTKFTTKEGLCNNNIRSIAEDKDGNLWFGGSGGVCRYTPNTNEGLGSFTHFTITGDAMNPNFSCILEDKQGNLWFGTVLDGVIRYDPTKGGTNGSYTHLTTEDGLGGNNIFSILEDRQGSIWFGSFGGGASRYGGNSFTHFSKAEGLNARNISTVLADSRGNLWLGIVTSGGLFRFDPPENGVDGSITHFTTEEGLKMNSISSITEDRQGNIWIGTNGRGASRFKPDPDSPNGTGGSFTHFTTEHGLNHNTVTSIEEDNQGNLWFGTFGGGVNIFDPNANRGLGSFIHFTTEEGLISNNITSITEDNRGNLWIEFYGQGITRYEADPNSTDRLKGILTHFSNKEGLIDKNISSVTEDNRGNLWLVTSDSNVVIRYNGNPNSRKEAGSDFTHFSLSRNMDNPDVIGDDQGRVWIISRREINVLAPFPLDAYPARESQHGNYQLFSLDTEDGFRRFDISTNACLDRQNHLWWGTFDGLTMLDLNTFELPKETPKNPQLSQIDLKQTFVDYRRLIIDPDYQKALSFGKPLVAAYDSVALFHNYPVNTGLPYNLNHLTFHFAAIDWAVPHKLQYSYVLEGLDEEWSPLSSENKADYRNLAPGRYIFKVKAIGAAGKWSEVFEYPFRIRPPWWAAWWAFLSYGLLGLYLLYHLYRYLLARKLEQTEIVRLQELDAFKTRLYTNITHEFRTPLTIILGMARQIKEDPKKWFDEGLLMITRNGRQLLGLVNQMLDLSKLDKGKLTLKLQQGDVVGFIRYLVQSFESLAAGKNIQLHFLKKTERLEMDFDPDQLTKIVSNLLSNALKFTPEEGHVYVMVQIQTSGPSEVLELSVQDTGPGIPAEELPHIFDRFYQVDGSATRKVPGAGVGLALAKELVHLMGGEIAVQSVIGEGTNFSVRLPVSRAAKAAAFVDPSVWSRLEGEFLPEITRSTTVETHASVRKEAAASDLPVDEKKDGGVSAAPEKDLPVVLLIEDDRDVLTYLASCLDARYQLEFARNGHEGIEQALEIVPDLIVSDVMMPQKDGYEVCAALKEDVRTSHIPIVLLTAKADQASKLEGLKAGADAYLSKPFDKEELDIRLEKLLESRRQLQSRYNQLHAVAGSGEQTLTKEDAFLQDLRRAVDEHLPDESFGTAQLCRQAGMSRSQLHRKLKALTGQSASAYIRAIRLEKARQLLRNTDLNISEVAYETGFRTPMYFTQVFSEAVGVAPSAYRMRE